MDDTKAKIRADEKLKCTTEQFWAVATFVGLNGFLLARDLTLKCIPSHWIAVAVGSLDIYAIFYIYLRAKAYARLDRKLDNILNNRQEDEGAAGRMKLSDICGGAGLYMLLIFLTGLAVILKYWPDRCLTSH